MIVRSVGTPHGQKALAFLTRSWERSLATVTSTIVEPVPATAKSPSILSAHPKVYSSIAKAENKAQQEANASIPERWREQVHVRKHTNHLGGTVVRPFDANTLLKNPRHDVSLELLMASQAHMGHHTSLWNPATSRFIYGIREGIHMISLEATAAHLRRAARVVEQVAFHAGLILFMGSRHGHMPIVTKAAELAGACHLFNKWLPGTITNRDQILSDMPMKMVDEHDHTLTGYEEHLRDRRPIKPDLVVCLNPVENYTMLYECGYANIPTIGIIDTNADPSWVTYSIPANDDSLRSVALISGVLGRAGQRGRIRRLEAAQAGTVTWKTPEDVRSWKEKLLREEEVRLYEKVQT